MLQEGGDSDSRGQLGQRQSGLPGPTGRRVTVGAGPGSLAESGDIGSAGGPACAPQGPLRGCPAAIPHPACLAAENHRHREYGALPRRSWAWGHRALTSAGRHRRERGAAGPLRRRALWLVGHPGRSSSLRSPAPGSPPHTSPSWRLPLAPAPSSLLWLFPFFDWSFQGPNSVHFLPTEGLRIPRKGFL